jgi:hypothetical protein
MARRNWNGREAASDLGRVLINGECPLFGAKRKGPTGKPR